MEDAFPGRLRELREQAGLTQTELADRVGVKRDAVARWEAGNREPGWSNVLSLAAALGVECTAFNQAPAIPLEEPKKGRPARADSAAAPVKGKKRKGR